MTAVTEYLAVYGTLRPASTNEYALLLREQSHYVGEGTFPGQLFDLGNYPGAIYQPEYPSTVHVSIFDVTANRERILTHLDDYEGVGEGFTLPTEYIRTQIPVRYNEQCIICWAYLYNWPINLAVLIESGDFSAYRNAQKDGSQGPSF